MTFDIRHGCCVRIESALIASFLPCFMAQYHWIVPMKQVLDLCSRRLEYLLPALLAADN